MKGLDYRRGRSGFTLIELMIALALFILFIAIAFSALKVLQSQAEGSQREALLEKTAEDVFEAIKAEVVKGAPFGDMPYFILSPSIAQDSSLGLNKSPVCLTPVYGNFDSKDITNVSDDNIQSFYGHKEYDPFINLRIMRDQEGHRVSMIDNNDCSNQRLYYPLAFTTTVNGEPAVEIIFLRRTIQNRLILSSLKVLPKTGSISLIGYGSNSPIKIESGPNYIYYKLNLGNPLDNLNFDLREEELYTFPPEVALTEIEAALPHRLDWGDQTNLALHLVRSTSSGALGDIDVFLPDVIQLKIALISYPTPYKLGSPPRGENDSPAYLVRALEEYYNNNTTNRKLVRYATKAKFYVLTKIIPITSYR